MKLRTNRFQSYEECILVREEFPFCAVCGKPLKAQNIEGEWLLLCTKSTAHRGIDTASSPRPTIDPTIASTPQLPPRRLQDSGLQTSAMRDCVPPPTPRRATPTAMGDGR